MTESAILSKIAEAEPDYQPDVLDRYTAIAQAEEFSAKKIQEIRTYVDETPPPSDAGLHLLAAAGSLARKEASSASDLDLIVILEGSDAETLPEAANKLVDWRKKLCSDLGLEAHNPRGVFANPVSREAVLASAGNEKEGYSEVAIRVLLLLESDWVLNQDSHAKLIARIVKEYSADIRADPRKNFVFLMNDVIRYFRTICVNYQYTKSETEDGKWPIRNLKLRHSRVLMYFSMIASIGLLSKEHTDQKIEALTKLIKMPPLRRLYLCYKIAKDPSFYKVAGLYDVFLDIMSKEDVRKELKGLEYADRYTSRSFAHLKATSDALCSELLRFYEARRTSWDDRFFEYMIV